MLPKILPKGATPITGCEAQVVRRGSASRRGEVQTGMAHVPA